MSNKIEEKKKTIVNYIDYMSDDLIDFIHQLTSMGTLLNKDDLRKLGKVSDEDWLVMDTAIPLDYARSIRELHPNFDEGNMVYDYSKKSFGEMKNLNDDLASRILNLNKNS
tara:strand:- start:2295 stop:2627 length:333 start_codon:yes stop_codon:yes gene_type:complete